MTIICWGNLSKSADSTQKIEGAISEYIETHDENPNAHMGADYSLGAHRLQVEIDHLPYSVKNKLLYPQSRTYKAIVDPTGNGDVTTIQGAIDYVNGLGGGSILVKAGTYIQSADITLYSNIELVGEDNDTTIIDFNNLNKCFVAVGTSVTHKKNINIRNIQIKNAHDTDYGQFRMDYCDDCEFENVYFNDGYDVTVGTVPDLTMYKSDRIYIKRCRFVDSGYGLSTNDCDHIIIAENYFNHTTESGIVPGSGNDMVIRENLFENLVASNIFCETAPIGLAIINNTFITVNGSGIYISSPDKYRILGNFIHGTTGSTNGIYIKDGVRAVVANNIVESMDGAGIKLSNQDYCTIIGNICTENAVYGIDISNNTCNKNVVVANHCLGNSTGNINNAGTDTVLEHNISA